MSQALLDARVAGMETHAHSYAYSGATAGGYTYAGWPIDELLNKVYPRLTVSEFCQLKSAFMGKHNNIGRISFPSSPPHAVHTQHWIPSVEMIAMRMRWYEGECSGFAHIAVHMAGDKVHTWVITNDGQAITIEDDAAMFPSDALITKLNMLKQE